MLLHSNARANLNLTNNLIWIDAKIFEGLKSVLGRPNSFQQ